MARLLVFIRAFDFLHTTSDAAFTIFVSLTVNGGNSGTFFDFFVHIDIQFLNQEHAEDKIILDIIADSPFHLEFN